MVTADRGEAGGMRKPVRAARLKISGEAESGKSHCGTDRSTGRGGAKGTAAKGGAEGFSHLGEIGVFLALGLTKVSQGKAKDYRNPTEVGLRDLLRPVVEV